MMSIPSDSAVKNLPAVQETQETGSIPGSGRSPGVGHGNYSGTLLGESHGQRSLVLSWTGLKQLSMCVLQLHDRILRIKMLLFLPLLFYLDFVPLLILILVLPLLNFS